MFDPCYPCRDGCSILRRSHLDVYDLTWSDRRADWSTQRSPGVNAILYSDYCQRPRHMLSIEGNLEMLQILLTARPKNIREKETIVSALDLCHIVVHLNIICEQTRRTVLDRGVGTILTLTLGVNFPPPLPLKRRFGGVTPGKLFRFYFAVGTFHAHFNYTLMALGKGFYGEKLFPIPGPCLSPLPSPPL